MNLEVVTNAVPALIAYLDATEIHRFANAAYAKHCRRDAASIVGRSLREILGDVDYANMRPHVMSALSGRAARFMIELDAGDEKKKRCVEATFTPDVSEDGSVSGFTVFAVDVRAHRFADHEATVERDNLHLLLEQVPAAIAVLRGPDHVYELSNPFNQQLAGGRQLVGNPAREAMPELAQQGLTKLLDDVRRTGQAIVSSELPIVLPGSGGQPERQAWLAGTYSPMRGRDGDVEGVIAFAYEVTEQVQARKAAEANEARYRALADAVPAIVWRARPDGVVEMYNEQWTEFTGQVPTPSTGWADAMHPDDVPIALERWRVASSTAQVVEMEFRLRRADGVYRWYLGRSVPLADDDGKLVAWFGAAIDIDDQKRAEERLRFLAEASNALAASLDYKETLRNVAKLAVPRMADWCSIMLRETDDRPIRQIVAAHFDPTKAAFAETFARKYPPDPDESQGLGRVLRSGKAELHSEISPEQLEAAARDAEHLEVLRGLGMRSVMIVPLNARGRTLGAVVFVAAESRRRFDDADLAAAQELADRAAYAVDNAALYRSAEASWRSAEEASRLKEEFLATVSHELRTPLSAILGWATMLRSKSDPASFEKGIAVIERNARSQLRLIEDILDVSRINRGQLRLESLPIDVVALADDVILSFGPATEAKHLDLRLDADDRCRVVGDPERIRQVIWNLVSNAVKFTPPHGRIDVTITKDGDRVRIRLRDTGQGISPEFLPHAFERFTQADSSATRKAGGLGLGLAIVRHIAELHGGTVDVESDGIGKGATFMVTLPERPFASPASPAIAERRPSTPPPPVRRGMLAGRHVLVVEDDDDARELVEALLEAEGARVTTTASAEDALLSLEANEADVLVSDIGMPIRDGYWLIEQVRARWPALPAIALTAFTRQEDDARARAAGFDHHLGKPVEPQRLVQVVAACEVRRSAEVVGK